MSELIRELKRYHAFPWGMWVECFLFLIIGLIVRLDFLMASHFVIDSDEAIVGLMAKHIAEGKGIPVFYYGQAYMGSLEALCAAALFVVFGVSSIALKIVPLLWSLVLIASVYLGARRFVSISVARIAALLVAIASNGFLTWSIMARGGFIEIIVIGFWSLLALLWWSEKRLSIQRAVLTGFLLGLGWWTNNQIVFFCLPAAVLAILIIKDYGTQSFKILSASAVSFFIGSSPFWGYNIVNGFPSESVFGLADRHQQWIQFVGVLTKSIPILMGSRRFWSVTDLFCGATLLVSLVYLVPLIRALFEMLKERKFGLRLCFWLIVPWSILLFSLSKYGFLVVAPRYLLPLIPIGSIVFAEAVMAYKSSVLRIVSIILILGVNLASLYLGGRSLPGQPFVAAGERVSKSHDELIRLLARENITKVRTNYWIGYRLAFETKEATTFGMLGLPDVVRISQYEDGINENTPLLLMPSQVHDVFDAFKAQRKIFQIDHADGYVLLHNISDAPCKTFTTEIQGIAGKATSHQEQLTSLFDHNLSTRWGSGAPQAPDMKVELELPPTMGEGMKKLSWSSGEFKSDFPRSLQIQALVSKNRKRYEILSERGYQGLRFLSTPQSGDMYVCVPPKVTNIVMNQLGKDKVFDWSMAEVAVTTR